MSALAYALRLAAAGIPAFACNSDKRPLTKRGFYDATTEPDMLRRMFASPGAVLVAVRTGAASGLVVLDGDEATEASGVATLRQWTQAGRLPRTRTHRTRRGGVHLLFRHHPGHPLRSTAGRLAPLVDTRGDAGYVIWWPAAGGVVLLDMALDALPVLPEWVDEAVAVKPVGTVNPVPAMAYRVATRGPAEARLAAIVRHAALAPEGQRNGCLYWAARRCAEMVASGTLAPGAAEAALVAAGCHAGLLEREAAATARSGLRGGAADGR